MNMCLVIWFDGDKTMCDYSTLFFLSWKYLETPKGYMVTKWHSIFSFRYISSIGAKIPTNYHNSYPSVHKKWKYPFLTSGWADLLKLEIYF